MKGADMQTMELVRLTDVRPYDYNGQKMNPRDFEAAGTSAYIARLAEQFSHNRLNPGQPRVRPILYRDGGGYLIVDGECRYEAMRRLGTESFLADVYDDLDDAEVARQEAAKAMVETDSKLALGPTEMSRGVQTMLALDVPDEEVASASGIEVGTVRRARRGARAAEGLAYDMTIDRLLAIADFEGDAEAVERLRTCAPAEWEGAYRSLRDERERERATEAVRALCDEMGVEVVDEAPEGLAVDRCLGLPAVDELRRRLEQAGPERVVAIDGRWVVVYRDPDSEGQVSPEEQERQRDRERFVAGWQEATARRDAWVAERVADPSAMPETAAYLMDYAAEVAEGFLDAHDIDLDLSPTPLGACVGWSSVKWPNCHETWSAVEGGRPWCLESDVRRAVDVYEAMANDGYEPGEAEERGVDALANWLNQQKGGRR